MIRVQKGTKMYLLSKKKIYLNFNVNLTKDISNSRKTTN
jgi:hypothetical protein